MKLLGWLAPWALSPILVLAAAPTTKSSQPQAAKSQTFSSSTPAGRKPVKLPPFRSKLKNLTPLSKPETPTQFKPVVISPKAPAQGDPDSPFQLVAAGSGQLELVFKASSGLALGTTKPLLIELTAPDPIEVNPSVVTESTWPRVPAGKLAVRVSGTRRGEPVEVLGNASYFLCKKGGADCQRKRSRFQTRFTP